MSATLSDGLGASASRGALVTVLGQAARVVVQLTGTVILARLLTPADYGVLAMVLVIVGLGEVFRDFGLSSAAMQARALTLGQQSNLFWLNSAIGLLLATLLVLAAPLVAGFFGDSRLVDVARLLSILFLLGGISTQYRAALNRRMRFGQLAGGDIAGQAVGLCLGIVLAFGGAGYWALVWMVLVQAFVSTLFYIVLTRWIPTLYARSESIRSFLSYGGNLVGAQLLNYASRNVDTLVIGSQFGAAPLGIYNRAFQLLMLPLSQVNAPATRVALPTLSRLQDDKERFDKFLLRGQLILAHFLVPPFAFLAALAVPIIELALGPKWSASAPLFQILALAGVLQIVNYSSYWAFLAKGLTRHNLHLALVIRPMLVVLVLLGSLWGVEGIAWAYSISYVLIWPISLIWLGRVSDAPVMSMFTRGLGVLLVYGFCAALAYWFSVAWPLSIFGQLLAGFAGMLLGFIILFVCLPFLRRDTRELVQTRIHLRKRRKDPPE